MKLSNNVEQLKLLITSRKCFLLAFKPDKTQSCDCGCFIEFNDRNSTNESIEYLERLEQSLSAFDCHYLVCSCLCNLLSTQNQFDDIRFLFLIIDYSLNLNSIKNLIMRSFKHENTVLINNFKAELFNLLIDSGQLTSIPPYFYIVSPLWFFCCLENNCLFTPLKNELFQVNNSTFGLYYAINRFQHFTYYYILPEETENSWTNVFFMFIFDYLRIKPILLTEDSDVSQFKVSKYDKIFLLFPGLSFYEKHSFTINLRQDRYNKQNSDRSNILKVIESIFSIYADGKVSAINMMWLIHSLKMGKIVSPHTYIYSKKNLFGVLNESLTRETTDSTICGYRKIDQLNDFADYLDCSSMSSNDNYSFNKIDKMKINREYSEEKLFDELTQALNLNEPAYLTSNTSTERRNNFSLGSPGESKRVKHSLATFPDENNDSDISEILNLSNLCETKLNDSVTEGLSEIQAKNNKIIFSSLGAAVENFVSSDFVLEPIVSLVYYGYLFLEYLIGDNNLISFVPDRLIKALLVYKVAHTVEKILLLNNRRLKDPNIVQAEYIIDKTALSQMDLGAKNLCFYLQNDSGNKSALASPDNEMLSTKIIATEYLNLIRCYVQKNCEQFTDKNYLRELLKKIRVSLITEQIQFIDWCNETNFLDITLGNTTYNIIISDRKIVLSDFYQPIKRFFSMLSLVLGNEILTRCQIRGCDDSHEYLLFKRVLNLGISKIEYEATQFTQNDISDITIDEELKNVQVNAATQLLEPNELYSTKIEKLIYKSSN